MAFGKAVIASAGGGTNEIVKHNLTGILVEPNNENDFRDALESLIKNPDKRLILGQNARKQIKQEFSIETMCNNMLRLYESVLPQSSVEI